MVRVTKKTIIYYLYMIFDRYVKVLWYKCTQIRGSNDELNKQPIKKSTKPFIILYTLWLY